MVHFTRACKTLLSENNKTRLTFEKQQEKNKNIICRPWSVRIEKNCALGLEHGPRPAASGRTQDLWHSFSQYGPPGRQIIYIYFFYFEYFSDPAALNVSSLCFKGFEHTVFGGQQLIAKTRIQQNVQHKMAEYFQDDKELKLRTIGTSPLSCPLCKNKRRNFTCESCIENGNFGHCSGKYNER